MPGKVALKGVVAQKVRFEEGCWRERGEKGESGEEDEGREEGEEGGQQMRLPSRRMQVAAREG